MSSTVETHAEQEAAVDLTAVRQRSLLAAASRRDQAPTGRSPRQPTGSSSTPASPSATPQAIVPYLAALGISDCYASPLPQGRAGKHARLRHHRPSDRSTRRSARRRSMPPG